METIDIAVVTWNLSEWERLAGHLAEHTNINNLFLVSGVMNYEHSAGYRCGGKIYYGVFSSGPYWVNGYREIKNLPFLLKTFVIDVEYEEDFGFRVKSRRDVDEYLEYYGDY